MEIKALDNNFTVCKISSVSQVNFDDEFCFIGKTDEELSLVCSSNCAPCCTIERVDNWRAFRIQGVLDFSLTGVLSKIAAILADNNIAIFAISTFNTDYILTKANDFERAMLVLAGNGYTIVK